MNLHTRDERPNGVDILYILDEGDNLIEQCNFHHEWDIITFFSWSEKFPLLPTIYTVAIFRITKLK